MSSNLIQLPMDVILDFSRYTCRCNTLQRYPLSSFLFRSVRNVVQAQQGSRLLQLQIMGELRLCHRLRLLDAPLRTNEAVRDADGADDRRVDVHRRRSSAHAQVAEAEAEGEASGRSGSEAPHPRTRGDRRREGRHRRRDHCYAPLRKW